MNITYVDNNLRQDRCPLCKSGNIGLIGELDCRGKVDFSTHEIKLGRIPELWECRQCLSCFVQNAVRAEVAKMLYSTGRAGERWSTLPFDQIKTREVIDSLAEILKRKGSILDVGCNTGELLYFAGTFGCATSGLEYSEVSRETIRNKGHIAYQSFDEVTGQFDVITAFDLIEHLYDVPGFLSFCHDKLVNGGRLILLTGDIQSASARAAGAHWWYAQYPEHIAFPSQRFLENQYGFTLESWLPTYAAAAYNYPGYRVFLSRIKRAITGEIYNGLPSPNPDHALIVLTKNHEGCQ